MAKRRFAEMEAQVTFARNWTHTLIGRLVPGSNLHVNYDAMRLPRERSKTNGRRAWTIQAFAKFHDDAEPQPFKLRPRGGNVLTKTTRETGGGTMMSTVVPVPQDAQFVTMWFMNTGASGKVYWDSAYGANYTFRFASIDIQDVEATVRTSRDGISRFEVSLKAGSNVESVTINFRVLNAQPFQNGTLVLRPDDHRWNGVRDVPYNAVIAFEVSYIVAGRSFVDDNSAQSFLAPRPGTKEAEIQAKLAAGAQPEDVLLS